MDVSTVVRQRLKELGFVQQDLAAAAQVTESYISQLLKGKKLPPSSERTDIYEKMGKFLRIPPDRLEKLADLQRREELKRKIADPPSPLYREVRELILKKCKPGKAASVCTIFETRPFGELERLVTQKLLDVVKQVAREELVSDDWLKAVARLNRRKHEEMRVAILEFLDTDVFRISPDHCVAFLEPLIESWDIDLGNFGMEILLNRRLAHVGPKRFEFVETEADGPTEEPGLVEFLRDPLLSQGTTEQEIDFLRKLRLPGKHPTRLYYYRELQNLRDPLNFSRDGQPAKGRSRSSSTVLSTSIAPLQKYREVGRIEKQFDLETRKAAVHRWVKHTRSGRRKANQKS